MTFVNINSFGTDHTIWMKGLGFYDDEIDIMESRLTELVSKNTSFEARQGVEHFQNQFMIQKKNISALKHEVNSYVKKLSFDSEKHAGHVQEDLVPQHHELHEKYEALEKLMNGLRHEFLSYLGKWM